MSKPTKPADMREPVPAEPDKKWKIDKQKDTQFFKLGVYELVKGEWVKRYDTNSLQQARELVQMEALPEYHA